MNCPMDGVIIRELNVRVDERGWLVELFRKDESPSELFPKMGYVSMTRPGMSRGPHEHRRQTDQFVFLGIVPFRLYLWDNRTSSPTYMLSYQTRVEQNHAVAVLVPPGVVHAYRNIGTADGYVFNSPDALYGGFHRAEPIDEIRHELDPDTPFLLE